MKHPYTLQGLVMIANGLMVLTYFFFNQLSFFIYPLYIPLVVGGAIFLILIGLALCWKSLKKTAEISCGGDGLFSSLQNSFLMIIPLLIALLVQPAPLSSQTANNRGVGAYVAELSTHQAPSFTLPSTERSLIDWVRMIQVRPNPEEYVGQEVLVKGLVVNNSTSLETEEDLLMVATFVVSCCAADARPVGLFMRTDTLDPLPEENTWIQLSGTFTEATINGQRYPVIIPSTWNTIPIPSTPYEYL